MFKLFNVFKMEIVAGVIGKHINGRLENVRIAEFLLRGLVLSYGVSVPPFLLKEILRLRCAAAIALAHAVRTSAIPIAIGIDAAHFLRWNI